MREPNLGVCGSNLSIMIPNYNYGSRISETLESLKLQGGQIADAEIVVVDNCSTDDSEEVVRKCWGECVRFHKHPKNIGALASFNSCFELAEREWIHILHSDDFVLPGAYHEFNECLKLVPTATAVFSRSRVVDGESNLIYEKKLLSHGTRGEWEYNPESWISNPVEFVGSLVSRTAVSRVGNFRSDLPCVSDWNFFWRIAKSEIVAFSNVCTGAYRVYIGNDSSKVMRTGENLYGSLQQLKILSECPLSTQMIQEKGISYLYRPVFDMACAQCLARIDDKDAFQANLLALKAFPQDVYTKSKISEVERAYSVFVLKQKMYKIPVWRFITHKFYLRREALRHHKEQHVGHL